MRFAPQLGTVFTSTPFAGEGASLYAQVGTSIDYRHCRLIWGRGRLGCSFIVRTVGGEFDIGGASVVKTARVASAAAPAGSIDFAVPPAWYGQTVAIDVRHYKDNVENETSAPQLLTFDGGGVLIDAILGTAVLLSPEQRDGGVVRLRFAYTPSPLGVQPATFTAHRTAGPSSPADATITYDSDTRLYEIDTPALLDSSPYTYQIIAANGAVSAVLLTGISVQADATGPSAPTGGSAVAW